MDQLVNALISRSTSKNGAKAAVHKVQIQPLLDECYDPKAVRKAARSLGFRLVDNDTKISIEGCDLKSSVEKLVSALKKSAQAA